MWNKEFIILLLINASSSLSMQIINPLFAGYVGQFATESQIGFLVSAYAIAGMSVRPFTGIVADRLDRKKILIFSQIWSALIYFGLSRAANIQTITVLRLVHGLTHGIATTSLMAMATAALPADKIGAGIGIYGVSTIGGQAIAPAIGLMIKNAYGYSAVFSTTIVMLTMSSFVGLALKRQPQTQAKKVELSLNSFIAKEALGQTAVGMIFMSGSVSLNNFLVVFAEGRGIENPGLFFTIQVCILIAIRVIFNRFLDRIPYQRILNPCSILCVFGLLALSFTQSFGYLIAAGILLGFGFGFGIPVAQASVMKQVPPERYGAASATYHFGVDIGLAVSSMAMGIIAEHYSYGTGFQVIAMPYLLVIPMLLFMTRKKKKNDLLVESDNG